MILLNKNYPPISEYLRKCLLICDLRQINIPSIRSVSAASLTEKKGKEGCTYFCSETIHASLNSGIFHKISLSFSASSCDV